METANQKDQISNDQFGDAENTMNTPSNETVNATESKTQPQTADEVPAQPDKVETEVADDSTLTTLKKDDEPSAKVESDQPAEIGRAHV